VAARDLAPVDLFPDLLERELATVLRGQLGQVGGFHPQVFGQGSVAAGLLAMTAGAVGLEEVTALTDLHPVLRHLVLGGDGDRER
jgi:hypothetical protein